MPQTKPTEQYGIYKHYKQLATNILNDQLHYKTHTLFDKITHAGHSNISALPTSSQPVPLGLPSIENSARGTKKLLLNNQVSKDFA